MVIPDWTAAPKPPKLEFKAAENSSTEAMARPLDRLAAAIVDVFVLLAPAFILLSAPMKRWLTASFILGSEPEFAGTIVVMVALGATLLVCYQAIMHYVFGATCGKMLFNLRVKPVFEGERLSFFACVARAWVWIFECLLLGLPMLSVYSNRQRRTLHDRISDTRVVVVAGTGVEHPAEWERGLVRGFFGACIVSAFVVISFQVSHFLEHMKQQRGLTALIERDASECDVVSKNVSAEDDTPHARLEMAMSLYAAGLVERTCLESELEREVAMQVPVGPITYLTQAFVNADDAEVSNSYLDQVCEDAPDTVECTMSQVVSKWSEEDWSSVEGLLAGAEKGSGYVEVWAVRHFMKQARYDRALEFLDSLSEHRELAEFSLVQRVKALYDSYQEPAAEVALAQAVPALEKEESDDLSSWMCAQQLQNGCKALDSLACRGIPEDEELNEIDFEHSAAALSRVMALECKGDSGIDYATFSEAVHDEDWQNFFRANLKRQKEDNAASFRLYAEVINSGSAPDLLRVEALRRLSQFASRQQMASLVDMWGGFESKEAWVKAGNLLFARLAQRNDQDIAMRVARHLINSEALSPQAMATLTDFTRNLPADRKPASRAKEDMKNLLNSYEEDP